MQGGRGFRMWCGYAKQGPDILGVWVEVISSVRKTSGRLRVKP
jgi:hypothetical protein